MATGIVVDGEELTVRRYLELTVEALAKVAAQRVQAAAAARVAANRTATAGFFEVIGSLREPDARAVQWADREAWSRPLTAGQAAGPAPGAPAFSPAALAAIAVLARQR